VKARLDAFQRSRVGLFVKKVMDDQAPNLAALLAWGTLSALLPLILGMLSVAGLILRDPQRLDQVYNTLLVALPADAAGPVSAALDGVRKEGAAPAGIIAIILLLFNGSSFFANMASVFDHAYHVEPRNFVMERVLAIVMLVVTTALLVISTLAAALGTLVGNVPIALPIGPVLGRLVGWSISIVSAFVLFILLYKILPNVRQTWRQVMPGALLSTVLLLVISQVFPLYVSLFPQDPPVVGLGLLAVRDTGAFLRFAADGNPCAGRLDRAYVFGVFLVFTFYLYLLGFVFVLGAELNAFLEQPTRSAALAEATTAAQRGRAEYDQKSGRVRPAQAQRKPSLAGRLLGFIGLVVAVLLLRGQRSKAIDERAAA